jgi:hypothetical protein
MNQDYPVAFAVDYPDRDLNRLTTALRVFTVIPIAIVLASIGGYSGTTAAAGGSGLLFIPPLLMILFRQKLTRALRSGRASRYHVLAVWPRPDC